MGSNIFMARRAFKCDVLRIHHQIFMIFSGNTLEISGKVFPKADEISRHDPERDWSIDVVT